MLDQRDQVNLLVGLALAFAVVLFSVFGAALIGASSGEVAGALGNVVGGMLGAAAAVFAVFLTLASQRKEEGTRVSDAVRTEVSALVKHVIWSIKICREVTEGIQSIPRTDGMYVVRNLVRPPTVFPAVADRVGLLSHPEATVAFYNAVTEATAMMSSFVENRDASAPAYVNDQVASSVADCLINALLLAKPIVADEARSRPEFSEGIRQTILAQIDASLRSARAAFPRAQS